MVDTNSRIDPSRKTVGAMYLDLAKNNTDEFVTAGDLTHELMKSFTDDLNETIASNPFGEEEFYITVYEKKDLQMKRSILRRLYCSKYRPYPEDDTIVFHVNPKNQHVDFCWCLPHSTEMENMLMTPWEYDKSMIEDIKMWKHSNYNVCLKHFGFQREGKTIFPSKENRDKPVNYAECSVTV